MPTSTPGPAITPRPVTPTSVPSGTVLPQPGKEQVIGGAPMMFVPAGEFLMGSSNSDPQADPLEKPQHTVYLDAFWMDKFLVTNALYQKCVDAGACQLPSDKSSFTHSSYYGNVQFDNYPVLHRSWSDAQAFCVWAGKRLPTEAEWEKAARGTDGRIYPWGNSFDKNLLNSFEGGKGDTTAVGNYPAGASPYSLLDMAGNVWEWVADWFDPNYYQHSPRSNPTGPESGEVRVLRGGSWKVNRSIARSAYRGRFVSGGDDIVGFRCARSFS